MTMITRLSPLLLAGLLGLSQPSPAAEQERVNTLSQFSDLQPSDWAYQALSNLIEHYGCVAGYPNGNFSGTQALSRYEAAALLNTCLDRITEVTDQLKRLTKEFERELAVLRGRVDALDAKVGVWRPASSPPPPNSPAWRSSWSVATSSMAMPKAGT